MKPALYLALIPNFGVIQYPAPSPNPKSKVLKASLFRSRVSESVVDPFFVLLYLSRASSKKLNCGPNKMLVLRCTETLQVRRYNLSDENIQQYSCHY